MSYVSNQKWREPGFGQEWPKMESDKTEDYGDKAKIDAILNWVEDIDYDFDTKFIVSVAKYYDICGTISDKQRCAINNIISKFQIDLARYLQV